MVNFITVVKPEIVDDLGVVRYEGKEVKIVEKRPDVIFRSITDLKAMEDQEVNGEPSKTDVTNYVDNRIVIEHIMRNVPIDIVGAYLHQKQQDEPDETEFDGSEEYIDEESDPLDLMTQAMLAEDVLSGAQATAPSKPSSEEGQEPSAKAEERSDDNDKQGE